MPDGQDQARRLDIAEKMAHIIVDASKPALLGLGIVRDFLRPVRPTRSQQMLHRLAVLIAVPALLLAQAPAAPVKPGWKWTMDSVRTVVGAVRAAQGWGLSGSWSPQEGRRRSR